MNIDYDDTISYIRPSIELVRARAKASAAQQAAEDKEDQESHVTNYTPLQFAILSLHSLGIIYGDIGTSPLYVMNTIFGGQTPTLENIIGACSLIIWSLVLLVTMKYAIVVLSADHQHQGGVFALCSWLVSADSKLPPTGKRFIVFLCIFGASLILGDGALTPAISVTSAIEGIAVGNAALHVAVMPITLIIIIILFLIQPFGTSKVGYAFGPLMLLWFLTIGGIGIYQFSQNPLSLIAFNPWMGIRFFLNNGPHSYLALGGVFLSATGVEALFADLGHFHQGPIRTTWLFIVFPSLVCNYLGQTSVLLKDPSLITAPFFHSVPNSMYWYVFVLATLAGIIASQAIITGSFSIISQAVSLGYAPPLLIKQTSKKVEGQIYCPAVNWILCVLTVTIVLWLQTSERMTSAYGITVCSDMALTTILLTIIMTFVWKKPWPLCLAYGCIAAFLDFSFWGSIIFKIPEGGWIALVYTVLFAVPMMIWYTGEIFLRRYRRKNDPTQLIIDLPKRFKAVFEEERASEDLKLLRASQNEIAKKKDKEIKQKDKKGDKKDDKKEVRREDRKDAKKGANKEDRKEDRKEDKKEVRKEDTKEVRKEDKKENRKEDKNNNKKEDKKDNKAEAKLDKNKKEEESRQELRDESSDYVEEEKQRYKPKKQENKKSREEKPTDSKKAKQKVEEKQTYSDSTEVSTYSSSDEDDDQTEEEKQQKNDKQTSKKRSESEYSSYSRSSSYYSDSDTDTINHSSSEDGHYHHRHSNDDTDDISFEESRKDRDSRKSRTDKESQKSRTDKDSKKSRTEKENKKSKTDKHADNTIDMRKLSKRTESRITKKSSTRSRDDIPEPEYFYPEDIEIPQQKVGVLPHVGVFLSYSKRKTPLTFEVFLNRTSGLPSTVVFLHLKRRHIPVVPDNERFKISTICANKIYYISVAFGYSEHVGSMVIPAMLMNASHLGLPQITLENMTLFVPADTVQITNKNVVWKTILNLYTMMKNLFFGRHRMPFPSDYTVYLATVASL